jgi:hypothetical protein
VVPTPWPNRGPITLASDSDGDALDMEVHRFRIIYNTIRPHQALADRTPKQAYLDHKPMPQTLPTS